MNLDSSTAPTRPPPGPYRPGSLTFGCELVQLARNAGARVIALAGGPRKVSVARELAAASAAAYTVPAWNGQVRAQAGPVDVVFDGVGGPVGQAAVSLLRDG